MSELHLFEAIGIEIEYMIVDRDTLAVKPIADRLLQAAALAAGQSLETEYPEDVELGDITWSNELQAHVVELKTTSPIPLASMATMDRAFQANVVHANELLEPMGAMLLPTGMHPLMDPHRELRLWAHANNEVYETFNRVFDCRGHGWANLQSVHVNLPFAGDAEFGPLHAALRLLLPIMPALAASSPIMDGSPTGLVDTRLEVYRRNSERIPSITGLVVPEAVFTRADYERVILERIRHDVAPFDTENVLEPDWVNARGCIARFDRGSIEIRVLDVQERPAEDLAVCAAIVTVLRALVAEAWATFAEQKRFEDTALAPILLATVRDGENATIDDARYLRVLGVRKGPCSAGELWVHLLEASRNALGRSAPSSGVPAAPLARRILGALEENATREGITAVYRRLAGALARGERFG